METIDLLLPEVKTSGNLSTMQLPDIESYSFWNLYNNRILSLEGEITDWDYNVVKNIINLNMMDSKKPIILLINSNGGLLDITTSIVSTIKASVAPVWTVNMGNALSGGCLIFLAGERRFTTADSWCMAHAGSGGLQGNYADTKEAQKVWDAQVKGMGGYIMERTGIDTKTYNKYKNKDWYLNDEQQIEFGFATEKLESLSQLVEVK